MFPYGNMLLTFTPKKLEYSRAVTFLDGMQTMKYTPQDIGKLVRETRKALGVTQKALALTSGKKYSNRVAHIGHGGRLPRLNFEAPQCNSSGKQSAAGHLVIQI